VAICVIGSFRWQSELWYVVGGNVCCCMFQVAICIFGSFRCNVYCCVLYMVMCVVGTFRWQCVLLVLLYGKVSCSML